MLDSPTDLAHRYAGRDLDREPSAGGLVERIMRLRAACLGLSQDLAASRRRLRELEAENRRLRRAATTKAPPV